MIKRMHFIVIILCLFFAICGCADNKQTSEEKPEYNYFMFSDEDISLYGKAISDEAFVEEINEVLSFYSKRSGIVDGSVSSYYKVSNDGEYKPLDDEAVIVINLKEKTNVKFVEDDSSFDNVDKIIIIPSNYYIGFETDGGAIRTYGIPGSNEDIKKIIQKWINK